MKNKKHVFTKNISLLCLSGLFIIFPISLHQNMSIKNEVPSIESESINGLVTEFDLGGNSSSLTLDTIDNGYVDTVYMWGNNEFGQLAFADNTNYNIPTEHPFSGGVALVDLEQGSRHSGTTLDVNANGEANYLYMWGANESGQLGLGSEQSDDYYNTAQWSTYIPDGNYINLELGDDDSGVTIDTTGDKKADSLYMWGANESGQLGLGDNTNYDTPQEVPLPEGEIIDFELGFQHSAVTIDTTNDGEADSLYMWGDNSYGQLGNGTVDSGVNTPEQLTINSSGDFIDLTLDANSSSMTVDTIGDGKADSVYVWGANESGQLGLGDNGTNNTYNSPTELTTLPNGTIIDFEIGTSHSGATIDTLGDGIADSLYMWGANDSGQLGLGDNINYDTPQEVNLDEIGIPYDLQLGNYHTGLTVDTTGDGNINSLYMWGANESGQLGLGDNVDYNTPQNIGFDITPPPELPSVNDTAIVSDINSTSATINYSFSPGNDEFGNPYAVTNITLAGTGITDNYTVETPASPMGTILLEDLELNTTYDDLIVSTTFSDGNTYDQNVDSFITSEIVPVTPPSPNDTATVADIDTTTATINYSFDSGSDENGDPYAVTEITLAGTGITDNYTVESPTTPTGTILLQDLELNTIYDDLIVEATFTDGNTYQQNVDSFTTLGLIPVDPSPNETASVTDIDTTIATINYDFAPGSDEFGNPYEVTQITLAGTGITDNYTVETPTKPTGTITLQDLELNTSYDDLIVSTTFTDGNTYDQNVDSFTTLGFIPVDPSPNDTATVTNIDTTGATINYDFAPGSDENGDPYEITEITLSGTGISNNYTVESPTSAIGTITLQDLELNTIYDDLIVLATFTDGNTYEQDVDSFTTLAIITNPSPNETATVSNIIDTNATVNYSFSPGNDEFGNPYEVTQITLTGTGITDNYTVKSPTSSTGKITLQDLDPETNYNDLIVSITFADGNTYQQNVDEFTTQELIIPSSPDIIKWIIISIILILIIIFTVFLIKFISKTIENKKRQRIN